MARAPRTRLPDVFAQLAQANSLMAQRTLAAEERERQERMNKGGMVGAVAGGLTALASGGSLPVIAAATNVGGQVGRAARGGQLDPVALSMAGLQVADILDRESARMAERDVLDELAPSAAATLQPGDVPATGALPGVGAPLPADARPDPLAKLMEVAGESSTPFRTAAQGLQIAKSLRPPAKMGTARPGDIITRNGLPIGRIPGGDEQAKGQPRQVWVNEGTPDTPKWKARSVSNNRQFSQLQEQFGPERVLLNDPTGGGAKGQPRQVWINEGDDEAPEWRAQSVSNNRQFDQLVENFGAGNVLLQDPTKGGADAAGKTYKERAFNFVADQAISRGDITEGERDEFIDFLIREDLAAGETTASGGRIPGLPIDEGIEKFRARRTAESAETEAATTAAPAPAAEPTTTQAVQQPTPTPRIPVRERAGEKPLPSETAGKLSNMMVAQKEIAHVRSRIISPEGVDRFLVAQMQGNVPFSEGRELRQALKRSLEAKIRLDSGAAVPDSEREAMLESYMPSLLDSEQGIRSKFDSIEAYMSGAIDLATFGRGQLSDETMGQLNALDKESADEPSAKERASSKQSLRSKYSLE